MDFEVGGNSYRAKKLNAFKQLFVARRLLGSLKGALTKDLIAEITKRISEKSTSLDVEDAMEYFKAFVNAVGGLSDTDLEFIINTCCESCLRARQDDNGKITGYFPLIVNDRHMFDDVTPVSYLTITYRVISEDLGSFFGELRSLWETIQAE